MLIAMEGADAAGKATQTKLLAARLERLGRDVTVLSFPRYQTELGQAILRELKGETVLTNAASGVRSVDDAIARQCMMTIDKYDAAPEMFRTLAAGGTVICDRWWPSACVYGAADGLSFAWLEHIHGALPGENLNIFLDVDPAEAIRRRPEARDRYEADKEKRAKVHAGYHELWRQRAIREPLKWRIVTGEGPIAEVHERIWHAVVERFDREQLGG